MRQSNARQNINLVSEPVDLCIKVAKVQAVLFKDKLMAIQRLLVTGYPLLVTGYPLLVARCPFLVAPELLAGRRDPKFQTLRHRVVAFRESFDPFFEGHPDFQSISK